MIQNTPAFIYFDLDDTLLNHQEAEREALRDIHQYFDLFNDLSSDQLIDVYHRVNSRQWLLYSRGKVTSDELQRNRFKITLRTLKLDETRFEEVGSQYLEFYQQHWQWLDGAKKTFRKIAARFSVGLLTNGFAETQKKKFAQFNLYDQAEHLIITEEVGAVKPHPKVFEYATKLAGCPPADILYVGDSYNSDVTGGADFGWQVAWLTQSNDSEKRQKADFVFSDFEKLTNLLKV